MGSRYRNPELYAHIKNYVVAVIKLLSDRGDRKYPSADWSDAPEFPFIFSLEEFKKLPEYRKCFEAIKRDTILTSHFNVLVGIDSRRSRSSDAESLMVRIPHLGVYRNRIEFNKSYFEAEYKAFEDTFYENDFDYEVVAPLSGPVFAAPIKLGEDLQICRVNRNGLTQPTKEDFDGDQLFGGPLWAIRTRYKLPKIVGDDHKPILEKTEENEQCRNAANDIIDAVLTCLRLHNISNVYPLTILHRTKSWLFHDVREYTARFSATYPFTIELKNDFNKEFVRFWKTFQSEKVRRWKFIAQAAKRFSYAHERHDWEDKIIDLLIAAEALFLSQAKGELSYRLRLNAARFLGADEGMRTQIFDDMGLAYDLRSGIVHGASIKSIVSTIKKREPVGLGEKYKLDQFTYRIQGYIRAAICQMIQLASKKRTDGDLVDWKDLVLQKL
jgi:hypothetical protein